MKEIWALTDVDLTSRLLKRASPEHQAELARLLVMLDLGVTPEDPPQLARLAERIESLTPAERFELVKLLDAKDLPDRLKFASATLKFTAGDPEALKFWASQADSAIHGMENRITQLSRRLINAPPGGRAMQLVTESQRELKDSILELAQRLQSDASRNALLAEMQNRYSENKAYSITILDYIWYKNVPSAPLVQIRAIQALIELQAIDQILTGMGSTPARTAVDTLITSIAYDPSVLQLALDSKPTRETAIFILEKLSRLSGWEREAGYTAALRLEETWQPRPESAAETTQADRDFAYYMAAAAMAEEEPSKAMEIASNYHHPSAAEVVGNRLKRGSLPSDEILSQILTVEVSNDVRLTVIRPLSSAVGTLDEQRLERFHLLNNEWFPNPKNFDLPSWHAVTRGISILRSTRDWPEAIALLNSADADPQAGSNLSIELHNHWTDWKTEGRSPHVDVSLMSPKLFISFLNQNGFQWELEPQNLKGYQRHLRGKDERWHLQKERSELLHLVRMARKADESGDTQSAWELLQIVSLSQLPLLNPWLERSNFHTRFPLAAYLGLARSMKKIESEITRLDASERSRPPIIISSALELAKGDETAALRRLSLEKDPQNIPSPSPEEKLSRLRSYLADSDDYLSDHSGWWNNWMEQFPSD